MRLLPLPAADEGSNPAVAATQKISSALHDEFFDVAKVLLMNLPPRTNEKARVEIQQREYR